MRKTLHSTTVVKHKCNEKSIGYELDQRKGGYYFEFILCKFPLILITNIIHLSQNKHWDMTFDQSDIKLS